MNVAGFDFGCTIDGSCKQGDVVPPVSGLGGPDGIAQMNHFAKDDHLNIFRLPVGWQYLVNSNLGGTLDSNNLGKYDRLVQGCLGTGAYCIIDSECSPSFLHNRHVLERLEVSPPMTHPRTI